MVLIDARRRQVDANGAYLKLLGYTRQAVIGTPAYAFVADGPLNTPEERYAAMATGRFTGRRAVVLANGSQGLGAVGRERRGRHRQAARAVRGPEHLALGAALPPRRARPTEPGSAGPPARTRDRAAGGARPQRPRDRGGAAHRPRHRPHPRPQRDDQARRALARAPGRQGARRRPTSNERPRRACLRACTTLTVVSTPLYGRCRGCEGCSHEARDRRPAARAGGCPRARRAASPRRTRPRARSATPGRTSASRSTSSRASRSTVTIDG